MLFDLARLACAVKVVSICSERSCLLSALRLERLGLCARANASAALQTTAVPKQRRLRLVALAELSAVAGT